MAVDKKISQLTSLAQVDVSASTDVLPIVDTSAVETKKITVSALVGAGATAGISGAVLTNGTINSTTIGATTPSTGAFTTLSASGAVSLNPANANVSLAPTGTGTVTINPATAGTINNMAIGGSSAAAGTFTSATVSTGNLTFSSTAQRITGDFSNATLANRLAFQTSTTNGLTGIYAIPNGTAQTAIWGTYNSSDTTNCSGFDLTVTPSEARLRNFITGTGTYLPMTFYTGGSERMRLDTSGNLGIGTATNNVFDGVAAARPLLVQSSSSTTSVGSSTNAITICNSDTTTNNVSQLNFAAITGASANQYSSAWIAAIHGARVNGQYPTGQLVFATSSATNSAPSEKMRIDSSGNVGIGVSSLTIPLQIGKGGGGNPATSGTTQTYGIARIGSGGAAALDVGTYAAGQVWMQGVNVTNLASNFDLVLQPNGGNVGIGGTAGANEKLTLTGTLPTSSNTSKAISVQATSPSGSTSDCYVFESYPATQAAAFTLGSVQHFRAVGVTIGASSAITNQYGFLVSSNLTGATNNYGFYSNIASGSNRWNFYAAGTASNYMAGPLGVNGGATDATFKFVTAACRSSFAANNETYALGVRYASSTGIYYIGATNSATPDLVFSQVGGSERMRLTDGGELYIAGTTDQGAYNLQCNGTGVWGAGAYVNGSDARLKDNIQSLDSGLDVVKAMRPVTFQYKPEYSKDQSIQPGFIAQELQTAMAGKAYLDGVVQEGPNHLNVAYQSIIPILVKAIQELEAKVAALEAK